jgi:hypothetical protein
MTIPNKVEPLQGQISVEPFPFLAALYEIPIPLISAHSRIFMRFDAT